MVLRSAPCAAWMERVAKTRIAAMKPGAFGPKGGSAQKRSGTAQSASPRRRRKNGSERAPSRTRRISTRIAFVSPGNTRLVYAQPVSARTGHGAWCAATAIAARSSLNSSGEARPPCKQRARLARSRLQLWRLPSQPPANESVGSLHHQAIIHHHPPSPTIHHHHAYMISCAYAMVQ